MTRHISSSSRVLSAGPIPGFWLTKPAIPHIVLILARRDAQQPVIPVIVRIAVAPVAGGEQDIRQLARSDKVDTARVILTRIPGQIGEKARPQVAYNGVAIA